MDKDNLRFSLITPFGQIKMSIPNPNSEEEGDDIWQEMMTLWKAQGIWHCHNWDDVEAKFNGDEIDYIDFNKVIGLG